MKDVHDSKTLPLIPEPKKRGRPSKGDRAMTAAEKQAAYRRRLLNATRLTLTNAAGREQLAAVFEIWLGVLENCPSGHTADEAIRMLSGSLSVNFPELSERILKVVSK